jgi:hypothetical protein
MANKEKIVWWITGPILSIALTIISLIFSPLIANLMCKGHKEITVTGKVNVTRKNIDFSTLQILVPGQIQSTVSKTGVFSFTYKTSFPKRFLVIGCTPCEQSSEVRFQVIENGESTKVQEYTLPIDDEALLDKNTFDLTINYPIK